MIALFVYPLVTAALYYLGAWALITRWLWRRYPPVVGTLMACAACSGFWYGWGSAWLLAKAGLPFPAGGTWAPLLCGFCSIVWTPVVAKRLIYDLNSLDPAQETDAPPPQA